VASGSSAPVTLLVSRHFVAAIFAFECATCGKVHEGSPSYGFSSPWYYAQLSEPDRANASLSDDTCTITDEGHTDYFVRAVVEVPIHGVEDGFLWGVWVSLSKASFDRYVATYNDPDESDTYFGWFSNRLPFYPDTIGLKTQVHPRKGGLRPFLEIERAGHPLAEDLADGISVERAQHIAETFIHDG
jgi:hypothetical protein